MQMKTHVLLGATLLFLGLSVPTSPAQAQGDDMCLMCHGDPAMLQGVERADRLLVTPETLAAEIQGLMAARWAASASL